MPYLTAALVLLMLNFSASQASGCKGVAVEKFKAWAEKKYCSPSDAPSTFILIDGSDPISSQSKAWLKKNIFLNKNLTHFEKRGSRLTVAYMANQPVADLMTTSVCYPPHPDNINIIFENPQKAARAFHDYGCAVDDVQNNFLEERTETGKSLIIEAIKEVFSNPRYNQTDVTVGRKFVLASDLYQNSAVVSFFELCTYRGDGSLKCPGFDELMSGGGRIASYLQASLPNMNRNDEVHIYNFNVGGKFDQSARQFWEEYFMAAGVPFKNIKYYVELDQH